MQKLGVKKISQIGLVVIALFVISTFSYYKTRDLIFGTDISVASPANGATVLTEIVVVRGQAKNLASIYMNGRPLIVDPEGNFEEELLLAPGYTKILLTGEDRFRREVEKTIEIVYKPTEEKPLTSLKTSYPHN